jgi:phosphohistidine phosphatase
MRTLVLMRHGHAIPYDNDAGDFSRPLERRGIADVATIARRLHALAWRAELIVASSARRTQETARTLAQGIDYPLADIVADPQLYNADLPTWQAVARALPDTMQHVALVGHNPGISQFAQWLLPRQRVDGLTPGTALLLECSIDSWETLAPGLVQRLQRETPNTPVR